MEPADEAGHHEEHDAHQDHQGADQPDDYPRLDENQHTKRDQQHARKHEIDAGMPVFHHAFAHARHGTHGHGARRPRAAL